MDFKEQLRKQITFLQTSCDQYDAGNRDEAIRIGTSLRVLFHYSGTSISLLHHLNATTIQLLSTCNKIPKSLPFYFNLVDMEFSPTDQFFNCRPLLAKAQTQNYVFFRKWWDSEIVYLSGSKKTRRRDMVLYATNKDGGAHVDESLPAQYVHIVEGLGSRINLKPKNGPEKEMKLKYAHLAPLRQMAYEVLNSPDLLKLCN